eukprot:gene30177-36455_t
MQASLQIDTTSSETDSHVNRTDSGLWRDVKDKLETSFASPEKTGPQTVSLQSRDTDILLGKNGDDVDDNILQSVSLNLGAKFVSHITHEPERTPHKEPLPLPSQSLEPHLLPPSTPPRDPEVNTLWEGGETLSANKLGLMLNHMQSRLGHLNVEESHPLLAPATPSSLPPKVPKSPLTKPTPTHTHTGAGGAFSPPPSHPSARSKSPTSTSAPIANPLRRSLGNGVGVGLSNSASLGDEESVTSRRSARSTSRPSNARASTGGIKPSSAPSAATSTPSTAISKPTTQVKTLPSASTSSVRARSSTPSSTASQAPAASTAASRRSVTPTHSTAGSASSSRLSTGASASARSTTPTSTTTSKTVGSASKPTTSAVTTPSRSTGASRATSASRPVPSARTPSLPVTPAAHGTPSATSATPQRSVSRGRVAPAPSTPSGGALKATSKPPSTPTPTSSRATTPPSTVRGSGLVSTRKSLEASFLASPPAAASPSPTPVLKSAMKTTANPLRPSKRSLSPLPISSSSPSTHSSTNPSPTSRTGNTLKRTSSQKSMDGDHVAASILLHPSAVLVNAPSGKAPASTRVYMPSLTHSPQATIDALYSRMPKLTGGQTTSSSSSSAVGSPNTNTASVASTARPSPSKTNSKGDLKKTSSFNLNFAY